MAGNPMLAKMEKDAQQNQPGSGSLYAGPPAPPPPPSTYAQAAGAAAASQAGRTAGAPPAASTARRMTMDDVIVKTGIVFVILVAAAVVGWNLGGALTMLAFGAAIVAFVLALVISFKKSSSPLLVILYSVFEGLFLGGISRWYQAYGQSQGNGNLVLQAVGATLVVFAVMLVVYKTGLVKVTARTTKVFMIMLFSYMIIGLISLVAALFGVGEGWGFYGVGGIGIIISLLAVGLAAFSLVIDFDGIVRMANYGVEEKESWRCAFGLMVSLVWLYLEILRLLAIVNRN